MGQRCSRLRPSSENKIRAPGPGRVLFPRNWPCIIHNTVLCILQLLANVSSLTTVQLSKKAGSICILCFLRPRYICMPPFITYLFSLSCLWNLQLLPFQTPPGSCSPINLSMSTYQHPYRCHESSQGLAQGISVPWLTLLIFPNFCLSILGFLEGRASLLSGSRPKCVDEAGHTRTHWF